MVSANKDWGEGGFILKCDSGASDDERLTRQEMEMLVYKVFYKDFDQKKGILLGRLTERRSDLRGLSALESGLKWAIATFGHRVSDRKRLFVVPEEV